jgi:hypothetical protein
MSSERRRETKIEKKEREREFYVVEGEELEQNEN